MDLKRRLTLYLIGLIPIGGGAAYFFKVLKLAAKRLPDYPEVHQALTELETIEKNLKSRLIKLRLTYQTYVVITLTRESYLQLTRMAVRMQWLWAGDTMKSVRLLDVPGLRRVLVWI